jgi:hypothetical protein
MKIEVISQEVHENFKNLKTAFIRNSVNYPPISKQTVVLQYFTSYNMN